MKQCIPNNKFGMNSLSCICDMCDSQILKWIRVRCIANLKKQQKLHCNFIWSSGTLQTTFYTWVQNRWPRTERSRAEPCWTILAPKLSCCTAHLQHLGCSCSVLSRVCMCTCVCIPCTGSVWPQLSLPLCWSLGRGWPLSPEATSKRPWMGWKGVGCQTGQHGCCFPGLWELGGWDSS